MNESMFLFLYPGAFGMLMSLLFWGGLLASLGLGITRGPAWFKNLVVSIWYVNLAFIVFQIFGIRGWVHHGAPDTSLLMNASLLVARYGFTTFSATAAACLVVWGLRPKKNMAVLSVALLLIIAAIPLGIAHRTAISVCVNIDQYLAETAKRLRLDVGPDGAYFFHGVKLSAQAAESIATQRRERYGTYPLVLRFPKETNRQMISPLFDQWREQGFNDLSVQVTERSIDELNSEN